MSGKLIAIEGIDGSGKGTQAILLIQRLAASGKSVTLFSFPRYAETAFGKQIGRFLNGEFGRLDQVEPLLASLLFAGDRFESKELLSAALDTHDLVVCDRYVASNIAHQAAKRTGAARRELMAWIEHLEYSIYGLPRPHLTIGLELSVPEAQRLIALKARRQYTDKAADLQEADGDYLEQVRQVYVELAKRDPAWRRISCLSSAGLRPIDEIAAEIFQAVS